MLDWYGRWFLRHPWWVLMALLVPLALAAWRAPELRISTSAESLLLESDPALAYFRQMRERYPEREFLLLAYEPAEGELLSERNLRGLESLSQAVAAIDGVDATRSLLDAPLLASPPVALNELSGGLRTLRSSGVDRRLAREELLNSPLYGGLVSDSKMRLAALQVFLSPDAAYETLLSERETLRDKRDAATAADLQRLRDIKREYRGHQHRRAAERERFIAEVRRVVEANRGDARVFIGGVPMISVDMVDFVRRDIRMFGIGVLAVIVGLLGFIFRAPRWVLLPMINCVAVSLLALGALAWLEWDLTVVSANSMVLLLVIALSMNVHLIVRYRELLRLHPDEDHGRILRMLVGFMWKPCAFMALTTIVSFASLFFSGVQPIRDFGWLMALGTLIALLWVFASLPPVLALLGRGGGERGAGGAGGLTAALARLVERGGQRIILVAALLAALAAWGISRLDVDNRFIDYFAPETAIHSGMKLIDERLGGTMPLEVILKLPPEDEVAADDDFGGFDDFGDDFGGADAGSPWFKRERLALVERAHDYLDRAPGTGKVLSLATPFKLLRDVLGHTPDDVELAVVERNLSGEPKRLLLEPWLSTASPEETRISLRVKETGRGTSTDQLLRELRAGLTEELGEAVDEVRLSGLLPLYNNLLQSLYRSQIVTLSVVAACIFTLFLILFGSWLLALIALLPLLLAAALALGGLGFAGVPLDIMTVTMAAIVIGIGIDHNIHYLWRFKVEFAKQANYMAAIHRCHASIGRALYYTSALIIAGFSVLTLSNFSPSVRFGALTAAAMACALSASLILLPQLLRFVRPLGEEVESPLN